MSAASALSSSRGTGSVNALGAALASRERSSTGVPSSAPERAASSLASRSGSESAQHDKKVTHLQGTLLDSTHPANSKVVQDGARFGKGRCRRGGDRGRSR